MTDQQEFELITPTAKFGRIISATTEEKIKIRGADMSLTVQFGTLVVGNDNVRKKAEDSDIKGLTQTIRRDGLIEPLAVEAYGKGKWLIIAGHRRYLALMALGFKAKDLVPVHMLEVSEGHERTTRMLAENVHRKNLNPIEEAEMIDRLNALYDMSQQDIAQHLGINKGTVNGRLNLLQLTPSVQQAVIDGTVELEVAQNIGRYIAQGGLAKKIAKFQADAANGSLYSWDVTSALTKLKGAKACDTLAARLSARGILVVTSLKRVPCPDGYFMMKGQDTLEADTAAKIKVLDIGSLRTVYTDGDHGVPYVLVESTHDGLAVAWTIQRRKEAVHAPSNSEFQVRRDAQALVKRAITAKRVKFILDKEPLSPILFQRVATSLALGAMPSAKIREVGEQLGLTVIHEPQADGIELQDYHIDEYATIAGWVESANAASLERMISLSVAVNPGPIDTNDSPPATYRFGTAVMLADGMQGSVFGEKYELLVDQATAKIKAKGDSEEEE